MSHNNTTLMTLLTEYVGIYGLASIMSMIVRRQDGPLMSMLVSLIVSVFSGYGPSLSSVKEWHLEWFWRLCPGVRFDTLSVFYLTK